VFTHLNIEGADGVNLHAVQAGKSSRSMLLLHGFPEFWQAWHRQLKEFSREFRAVALDLRGYNLSGKPAENACYALPKIVDDLRLVIRAISPSAPVVVVGHDWGGIAAWALAREAPELIERMVIINAPHPLLYLRELKQSPAQMLSSSYAGFFQLRGLAEFALRAFDFVALRKMVFGMSVRPSAFSDELRAAYREAWCQPRAIESGLNYYRNVTAFRRMLADPATWKIGVRTLVLWGEQDVALRLSNLYGLDEWVAPLTVRRHSGATHWIVHEEPEWVNEAIREFVNN
jgi:pimeloyl-ACP methyl ester carboxylesterase